MKLRFLGTAQDGGIPQAGCSCKNCLQYPRSASSIVLLNNNDAIVFDITPDFRAQWSRLCKVFPAELKSIYLTHAHWGHYGGLPLLGQEAWNIKKLPIFMSEEFSKFIQTNEPFKTLVTNNNIIIHKIEDGLESKHNIVPINVPHRQDFTDTFAFSFELNDRKVIYLPCLDYFDDRVIGIIQSHDLAILDGTFYSDDELPERDITKIPHPRVSDSIDTFGDMADRIIFTHLNHSNPIANPNSELRQQMESMGYRIAEDGLEIE